MNKIKTGAIWAYSWIKGVNINKTINAVQLNDRHSIIMDQLLMELSLQDSILLYGRVKESFSELVNEREREVNEITSAIKEYKSNSQAMEDVFYKGYVITDSGIAHFNFMFYPEGHYELQNYGDNLEDCKSEIDRLTILSENHE